MRRVKERVPLEECKRRALNLLRAEAKREWPRLLRASQFARVIWPGVEFRAQGAGAAASRILKHLEKDGLAFWATTKEGEDWGWRAK